jgi:hypothetical protein
MRQDLAKVTHIDPATAGGAFDEMLPLVSRKVPSSMVWILRPGGLAHEIPLG